MTHLLPFTGPHQGPGTRYLSLRGRERPCTGSRPAAFAEATPACNRPSYLLAVLDSAADEVVSRRKTACSRAAMSRGRIPTTLLARTYSRPPDSTSPSAARSVPLRSPPGSMQSATPAEDGRPGVRLCPAASC